MVVAPQPTTLSTMNREESPVTGPIETIARGPRQRSLVAIGAAVAANPTSTTA